MRLVLMQIKEVEKRTGLTAKAIRLYEDEQLIKVNRSDNFYREYNEETVKQLFEIKLYRKLDVKISDLKRWKNKEVNIEDLLLECLDGYEKKEERINNKKDICERLLDSIKSGDEVDPDSYLATFEFLENDEFDQLKKSIDEITEAPYFHIFSLV